MTYALLFVLSLSMFPSSGISSHCSDVQVVGVRGSGQSGYGEQVAGVAAQVQRRVRESGMSVSALALDYPAISVSDSFGLVLLNGEYDESVERGADSLTVLMAEIAIDCPDTRIVLIGYSQGSQVIKVALEDSSPISRITAVGLLADPTRDPSQPGVVRLGGVETLRGGSFGLVSLPDYLRPVTVDVCVVEDSICERGGFSFAGHIQGYAGFSESTARRLMLFVADHPVNGLRVS